MRIYSLQGHGNVTDPEHGTFDVDEQGMVDVPDELGARLHATHIDGQRVWEDESERALRLLAEEDARRRDPATLLAAVEQMAAQQPPADPKVRSPKAAS